MKIVVTGATGNVGRPLVQTLTAAGATVAAVSRNAGPSPASFAADLGDPASLRPALPGADALFLLVPGAPIDHRALVATVRESGVPRIVLLSSQAAGTRPDAPSHAPLRDLEAAVQDSGARWTILRPGGFASNTFAWAPSIRARRVAYAPYVDVALPLVDPDDIAAVAATVLLAGAGHDDATYVLTGPEATTPRDRAAAIAAATGAPVDLVEQTPQEARAQLLTFMPPPIADGTLAILGRPRPDEQAVSPDVERVLGRPPAPFQTWATRNAAAFTS
ncbi:SDR family oxidoreductase [Dactylosporangium sp. NPDC000521]|uniref:SDR family oxidoreductase n=1 Tax=Dactylosporangium sp. NPDC000521 TaxID=3363975 RepID=UPI003679BB4A